MTSHCACCFGVSYLSSLLAKLDQPPLSLSEAVFPRAPASPLAFTKGRGSTLRRENEAANRGGLPSTAYLVDKINDGKNGKQADIAQCREIEDVQPMQHANR